MRLVNVTSRRQGKSELSRRVTEAMLDAGRTVVKITPAGAVRMRRTKHLTLIENIDTGMSADWMSIDELNKLK